MASFGEMLVIKTGEEMAAWTAEKVLVEAVGELMAKTEQMVLENRVGMISEFDYWKAWNKVTDAIASELSASERFVGDAMTRVKWENAGTALENVDFLRDYNARLLNPIENNFEAFARNLGGAVAAAEVLWSLHKDEVTTYEVGKDSMSALGMLLVGAGAAAAAVAFGLPASLVFLGTVVVGAGGGWLFGKMWEDILAPAIGLDKDGAPQLWDQLYENNGWARTLAGGLQDIINSLYRAAMKAAPYRRDPLTLDLDADGLETTGIAAQNPILFDHDGDNVKTATGWLKSDDAFLVLDRDDNGTIDNGCELFGDSTPLYAGGTAADGFAALAQEDSNHDGQVDAAAANFSRLRLWRDLNQDGISQSNELFTLASQNVAALKTAKTEHSLLLGNGNQLADLGGFIRTDGSAGTLGTAEQLADVDLAGNPFYSQFIDSIPLTPEAQNLPQMNGSGMVRDLRQAASLSPELAARLAALATIATRAEFMIELDRVIDAWAATSTMKTSVQLVTERSAAQGEPSEMVFEIPFMNDGAVALLCKAPEPPGTPADRERWQAQYQAALEISRRIGVLEIFNGDTFVAVGDDEITTGTGTVVPMLSAGFSGGGYLPGPYDDNVKVPLNDQGYELLNQSYEQLKDSIYAARALQTRLKPLDGRPLDIWSKWVALTANDETWKQIA